MVGKSAVQNLRGIYHVIFSEKIRKEIRALINSSGIKTNKNNGLKAAFDLYKSKGLMFVHIPKAAGVSVFNAIYGRDSWGHAPLSAFVDAVGRNEVYRIPRACIVRNPYLRLHSGYEYLRRGGRGKGQDFKRQEMLRPYESFEKFVKDYLASGSAMEILHFKPQNYWVTDPNGKLGVDYVGRFESIEASFSEMIRLFGLETAPLPKLNGSKTSIGSESEERKILDIFDIEMISVVDRVYMDDFRLFNYATLGH